MQVRFDAFRAFYQPAYNSMTGNNPPAPLPASASKNEPDAKARMANRQGTGSSLFTGNPVDDINRKKTLLGGS